MIAVEEVAQVVAPLSPEDAGELGRLPSDRERKRSAPGRSTNDRPGFTTTRVSSSELQSSRDGYPTTQGLASRTYTPRWSACELLNLRPSCRLPP